MDEGISELRVPIIEEQLLVEKRQVETDRLRVRTVVETDESVVEDSVRVGRLEVARVPLERWVTEAPEPYQDGDTLVIPVVEERLVTEKRLVVVEEVRITTRSTDQPVSIPTSLRRMRALVEHANPDQSMTGNH